MADTPLFRDASLQRPAGAYHFKSPLDGADRVSFFKRSGRYPLVLLATVDKDELLAPWRAAAISRMDPVELRRINDTTNEPIDGKPYTSRSLMACFDEAAKAFGWSQRSPEPKSMAEGDWLIGYGCAATCYPTQMAPSAARVRLQRDGRTRVEIAGHEIGTGAYTIIAQTASERLGVPLEKVAVFIGDSDLPPAPVAGGSNSTASTCSAVMMVCDQIRQRLFKAVMPNASLTDKAKETIGMFTTWTRRLIGSAPLAVSFSLVLP